MGVNRYNMHDFSVFLVTPDAVVQARWKFPNL